MMILLITRRASKAPDMRSRSQRVAKSFYLSLSLSLSLGGSNLFFEGKTLREKRELLRTSSFLPFIFFSHEQSFHGRRPKGGRPRGRNGDRYIERNAGKKSGSETRRSVNNVQLYILSILNILSILSILSILNHHKAGTHARTILLAISSMSSLPTVA